MLLRCCAAFAIIVLVSTLTLARKQPLGNPDRDHYCELEKKHCRGRKHVGCHSDGQPDPVKCAEDFEVLDIEEYHDLIVDLHNQLRNKVALGETDKPKAAAMFEVSWDNKLARTAFLNALTCEMKHDECRSEDEYPYAGQNLALPSSKPHFIPDKQAVEGGIMSWYNEIAETTKKNMRGDGFNHFTAMMNGKQLKVGCAAVKFADKVFWNDGWKSVLFACNYSWSNFPDPVYEEAGYFGRAGSKCPNGVDKKYKGLCVPPACPTGSIWDPYKPGQCMKGEAKKKEPAHAPKNEEESAPKHKEAHAPKHKEEHAPKHKEEHAPKHKEEHAPKHKEEHAPKHKEEPEPTEEDVVNEQHSIEQEETEEEREEDYEAEKEEQKEYWEQNLEEQPEENGEDQVVEEVVHSKPKSKNNKKSKKAKASEAHFDGDEQGEYHDMEEHLSDGLKSGKAKKATKSKKTTKKNTHVSDDDSEELAHSPPKKGKKTKSRPAAEVKKGKKAKALASAEAEVKSPTKKGKKIKKAKAQHVAEEKVHLPTKKGKKGKKSKAHPIFDEEEESSEVQFDDEEEQQPQRSKKNGRRARNRERRRRELDEMEGTLQTPSKGRSRNQNRYSSLADD